jgi:hypothetical protein
VCGEVEHSLLNALDVWYTPPAPPYLVHPCTARPILTSGAFALEVLYIGPYVAGHRGAQRAYSNLASFALERVEEGLVGYCDLRRHQQVVESGEGVLLGHAAATGTTASGTRLVVGVVC